MSKADVKNAFFATAIGLSRATKNSLNSLGAIVNKPYGKATSTESDNDHQLLEYIGQEKDSSLTIFISHRHEDQAIANVISRNLQVWGVKSDSIYQSSTASGGRPRFGDPLADDLRNALNSANLVILVYTFADQDWAYCMYECGLATDPQTPNTRIVVFQAADAVPKIFQNQIRVKINQNDIEKFTRQFHREEGFFPDQTAFDSDVSDKAILKRSSDFYKELIDVKPQGSTEEVNRWDFFVLKINKESLQKIDQKSSRDEKLDTIQEKSEVIDEFGNALRHFGFDTLQPKLSFNDLVNRWQNTVEVKEDNPKGWITDLSEEMLRAIENTPAQPTWELMKSKLYKNWCFYPVVNHVKINPDKSVEFQIYMYRVPGNLLNQPA